MPADLNAALAAIARELDGTLGVAIRYLPDGPEYSYNAELPFYPASVIKVPVLVEVFAQAAEGRLDLARRIPLRDADRVEGSGVLQYLQAGLPLTVRDLAELMIIVSDNTATNMLIELVGAAAVNARMRVLGLTGTTLAGKLGLPQPEHEEQFESPRRHSLTTPGDMLHLFELLWRGQAVSPHASAEMIRILEHQNFMELARYLPLADLTESAGREQSKVLVASKSGAVDGVRNDVGLFTVRVGDTRHVYIVSAFTQGVEDGRLWTVENVALRAIAEVSRVAYEYLLEHIAG